MNPEQHAIDPRDRLIFALDVAEPKQALALVDELGDEVSFYKLGLEIFLSGSYYPLVQALQQRGVEAVLAGAGEVHGAGGQALNAPGGSVGPLELVPIVYEGNSLGVEL